MGYHAKRSPSSAKVWTDCTASIDAQAGISDNGSEAARLGTCQHQLSAECLEQGLDPQIYLGRKMLFWIHAESDSNGEDWEENLTDVFGELNNPDGCVEYPHEVVVTQEMVDASFSYINFVRNLVEASADAVLHVEKQVPIGHITGEARDGTPLEDAPEGAEEATGTADVVIVAPVVLTTVDAKFGRVKVTAYDVKRPARTDVITGEMQPEVLIMNLQLALYLLGSLRKYGHPGIRYVKAIIVQPYLNHVSEYSCTVEELLELGEWIKSRASIGRTNPQFAPSFSNCFFCRARFTCKARERAALETALDGFDDIDTATVRIVPENQLGSVYAKVDMLMSFCKDVETRVYENLKAGRPVMRNDGLFYKLVAGKKGPRGWMDPNEAAKRMKAMRLKDDQMYTKSLVSPAAVEKLATAKKAKKGQPAVPPLLGATQWARLEALIHQADGSPSVALETDPRPAIAAAVDGFEDVVPDADSCDDLFN